MCKLILICLLSVLAFTKAEPNEVKYEINVTDIDFTCERLFNVTITTQKYLEFNIKKYGVEHFTFNCTDYKNQSASFLNDTGMPYKIEELKTQNNATWNCTIWIDKPMNDTEAYCDVTVTLHPKMVSIAVYILIGVSSASAVVAFVFTLILVNRKKETEVTFD